MGSTATRSGLPSAPIEDPEAQQDLVSSGAEATMEDASRGATEGSTRSLPAVDQRTECATVTGEKRRASLASPAASNPGQSSKRRKEVSNKPRKSKMEAKAEHAKMLKRYGREKFQPQVLGEALSKSLIPPSWGRDKDFKIMYGTFVTAAVTIAISICAEHACKMMPDVSVDSITAALVDRYVKVVLYRCSGFSYFDLATNISRAVAGKTDGSSKKQTVECDHYLDRILPLHYLINFIFLAGLVGRGWGGLKQDIDTGHEGEDPPVDLRKLASLMGRTTLYNMFEVNADVKKKREKQLLDIKEIVTDACLKRSGEPTKSDAAQAFKKRRDAVNEAHGIAKMLYIPRYPSSMSGVKDEVEAAMTSFETILKSDSATLGLQIEELVGGDVAGIEAQLASGKGQAVGDDDGVLAGMAAGKPEVEQSEPVSEETQTKPKPMPTHPAPAEVATAPLSPVRIRTLAKGILEARWEDARGAQAISEQTFANLEAHARSSVKALSDALVAEATRMCAERKEKWASIKRQAEALATQVDSFEKQMRGVPIVVDVDAGNGDDHPTTTTA